MTHLVDCVVLISNDKALTYYNKMIFRKHPGFHQVISVQDEVEAREKLNELNQEDTKASNLILVEINSKTKDAIKDLKRVLSALNKSEWELDTKLIITSALIDKKQLAKSLKNFKYDDILCTSLSFPVMNKLLNKQFKAPTG